MPVTGICDFDWSQMLVDDLGVDPANFYETLDSIPWKYRILERGTPRERLSTSKFHIRLKWLRETFNEGLDVDDDDDDDVDDERVAHYTRAFCMDLFGSVMFPDSSGDGVPAMYLQFLQDLEHPSRYNWGGAVLTHLYRELSRVCITGVESISGPMFLLQIWSWTRFAVGRPYPKTEHPPFGGVDEDTRNAFGVKWTTPHLWDENPRAGK